MKALLILLVLSLSINCFSQDQNPPKKVFLRIYNTEGKKIAKGKLIKITDSTLTLKRNKNIQNVLVEDMGKIKTKRSYGNNVLIGAAAGAGTLGVLGASSESNSGFIQYDNDEGFLVGTLAGIPLGASVGALTLLFKNSATVEINGSEEKWMAFKALLINETQN